MTLTVSIGVVGLVLSLSPSMGGGLQRRARLRDQGLEQQPLDIDELRLALDRKCGYSPSVKTFARRLVDDHESAEAELKIAAEGSGAAVPPMLDPEHQARLTALQGTSGTDFDQAYVADQGENHSNALTLYGDYMLWGEYESFTL